MPVTKVTGNEIADTTIDTNHLVNGAVDANKLDTDAVTEIKIEDAAVTRNKLDATSVVRRVIGGTNITLDPVSGYGDVTINASGAAAVDILFEDDPTGGAYSTRRKNVSNRAAGSWSGALSGTNNQVYGVGATAASMAYSVVVGGQTNLIIGDTVSNAKRNFIGAGINNEIRPNDDNIVSSGNQNSIVGGRENVIAGDVSNCFIGGGWDNGISHNIAVPARGYNSAIVAGRHNTVLGKYGFVGAGTYNYAGSYGAVVGGGTLAGPADGNSVTSWSFIGAGYNNLVSGVKGAIVAGTANIVSTDEAFIGAGSDNLVGGNGIMSGIVTGYDNQTNAPRSFIGGGTTNRTQSATFANSAIVAGDHNMCYSQAAAIVAGQDNTIMADSYNSAIVAGIDNYLDSPWNSFIGAGSQNEILADTAGIIGGWLNTIDAQARSAFIGGGRRARCAVSGEFGLAADAFNTINGSAQTSIVPMKAVTTDGTWTSVLGNNSDQYWSLGFGVYWLNAHIVAWNITDSAATAFQMRVLYKTAGLGATTIVGTPQINMLATDDANMTVGNVGTSIGAGGTMQISVKGIAGKTIRWFCRAEFNRALDG